MSITAINWAFEQPVKNTPKLVLVALADFSDEKYQCWPSIENLAKKCSLTKRATIINIQILENAGCLKKGKRWRQEGGQTSNLYILKVSKTKTTRKEVVNMTTITGEYNDSGVVNMTTIMGEYNSTPSKEEPSLKSNHQITHQENSADCAFAPSPLSGGAVSNNQKTKQDGFFISTPNGKKWGDEIDLKISKEIFQGVQVVCSCAKEPNWPHWANDVRLMRQQDNRTPADILKMFKWSNKHPFWGSNILSPRKLREKWDILSAQIRSNGTNTGLGRHNDRDYEKVDYEVGIDRMAPVDENHWAN